MRKEILAIAAAAILAPTFALANGGYEGNLGRDNSIRFDGPTQVTSVSALKGVKMGEQPAVVEGSIVRQLNHDKFLFNDGTGEIVVELDDDIYLNQNINSSTKLRMFGEYEAWSNEMEVEHVIVL